MKKELVKIGMKVKLRLGRFEWAKEQCKELGLEPIFKVYKILSERNPIQYELLTASTEKEEDLFVVVFAYEEDFEPYEEPKDLEGNVIEEKVVDDKPNKSKQINIGDGVVYNGILCVVESMFFGGVKIESLESSNINGEYYIVNENDFVFKTSYYNEARHTDTKGVFKWNIDTKPRERNLLITQEFIESFGFKFNSGGFGLETYRKEIKNSDLGTNVELLVFDKSVYTLNSKYGAEFNLIKCTTQSELRFLLTKGRIDCSK